MLFSTDGLDAYDAERSAIYDFSIYFLDGSKLCCETLFVKKMESPVTGEALKGFFLECMRSLNIIDNENLPKLSIWGVTDGGSNIVSALKQLQEDGTIEGWHNCLNHKLQLVIKDAITATPGMETTLETFQKNAAIYSRSRKERKQLRDECAKNNVACTVPPPANATRWFSNFRQLQAYLKAADMFKVHIAKLEKMHFLLPSDWKKAKSK